jgi:hypothetical protein
MGAPGDASRKAPRERFEARRHAAVRQSPSWMRGLRALLVHVWAGPASLLGLLLAPFFTRRSVVGGVLLCEGASWPRRLGWRYRAITFGHVVLCVDELDDETFRHESVHVAQYEKWGPLLIPLYLSASLREWVRGGHPYRDNPFEVEARR